MQAWINNDSACEASQHPQKVVVLKASVGGAVMLRRFFAMMPVDLPVTFVVIMPMAHEFSFYFAQRLSSLSGLNVKIPGVGDQLLAKQCWLFTQSDHILLSSNAVLQSISKNSSSLQPVSIIQAVASVFNHHAGAIFLSGESADIVDDCIELDNRGGFVFAQSASSCVVSGLSDAAIDSGCVGFCGTPEELMYALCLQQQTASQQ